MRLSTTDEIWVLSPTPEHRRRAAEYASVTLPWTFNRMMKNTSARGQQERALNIAKGIVAQDTCARRLRHDGVGIQMDRTSHRDEDFFDFRVEASNGRQTSFDVKSFAYYSDYRVAGRGPFSPELVIENASYSGPDWRRFFPMLIPHTQANQDKQGYIFMITASIDFRRSVLGHRTDDLIAAFPYGEHMPFFNSPTLIGARESAGRGVYVRLAWEPNGSLFGELPVTVQYEWDGKRMEQILALSAGHLSAAVGPVSVLHCIRMEPQVYSLFDGHVLLLLEGNDLTDRVLSSGGNDLNVAPEEPLAFSPRDFCNLILPDDYLVYVLGWITKPDFLASCRQYPAWVWPDDSVDRFLNRPWSMLTEPDRKRIERAGFGDCIKQDPTRLEAGWMKTTGKGNGAACYVFPNVHRGGIRETNLYVLPQDLETMDSFGE